MSSIQERLQLKRVPLDTWNVREQLCLASAVVRSGDQNWMSVSRALKTVGEPNRPADWYSQKSCAAQYGALLEHVETPKRKKRSSEGAAETPQESILKRLTQERIVEIQKNVAEMTQHVEQLKSEVQETRTTATSEERLRELWTGVEAARRLRERESQRRAAWLREREERRARAERNWRPTQRQSPGTPEALSPAKPAAPSSPLLTSLLKSSPVVTTPQHITHPANVVETISPSAGAPTLSMLLEKVPGSTTPTSVPLVAVGPVPVGAVGMTPLHHNKDAAIEHIKSQLVQIEQQLSAATPPPPPVTLGASLDDIEIKAEDVYAFSDIDIHIPPVPTVHMHKVVGAGPQDKPPSLDDVPAPPPEIPEVKEEPVTVDVVPEELPLAVEAPPPLPEVAPPAPPPEPEARISFPEVKFPTTEIKVIQPYESKMKEEAPPPSPSPPAPAPAPAPGSPEEAIQEKVEDEVDPTPVQDNSDQPPLPPKDSPPPAPLPEVPPTEESPPSPVPAPSSVDSKVVEIPLPEESNEDAAVDVVSIDPPLPDPEPETAESPPSGGTGEVSAADALPEIKVEDGKRDDDAEDSIPLKEIAKEESAEPEEPHTETDDDTPMELVREEEKDGKKKRDYSRKKKPDSRTCSGSESAEASAPESPGAGAGAGAGAGGVAAAGGLERQRKLWKKSVMLVYSRLCAHKYASLFLRPITDEEAPGYSVVVRRPMDLTTVRRQMEAGQIRTTAEFQRDILLMLSNALMYNSSEHSVYAMAKEMYDEAQNQLGMLLAAQAHAGLAQPPPPRRKRRRADSPALPTAKRHH